MIILMIIVLVALNMLIRSRMLEWKVLHQGEIVPHEYKHEQLGLL